MKKSRLALIAALIILSLTGCGTPQTSTPTAASEYGGTDLTVAALRLDTPRQTS